MNKANLPRSMSKKGFSPDNSACEGFFGRLKNEVFYQRDWKNTTINQFINQLDDYISTNQVIFRRTKSTSISEETRIYLLKGVQKNIRTPQLQRKSTQLRKKPRLK